MPKRAGKGSVSMVEVSTRDRTSAAVGGTRARARTGSAALLLAAAVSCTGQIDYAARDEGQANALANGGHAGSTNAHRAGASSEAAGASSEKTTVASSGSGEGEGASSSDAFCQPGAQSLSGRVRDARQRLRELRIVRPGVRGRLELSRRDVPV
jgi:hypothetical protein